MPSSAPSPLRPEILGLRPNGIGAVSSTALGDPDIIPLWFGESDLPTPAFIRDAAKRALDEGRTFYTFVRGLPALREGIARWASRQCGRTISPERVTSPGSAMLSINIVLQCLLRPGDNVVIVSPMWPNIFQAVLGMGAEPRFVRLSGGAGGEPWRLDMQRLFDSVDGRTKALFIASPSNPTGWIMSVEEQRAALAFARARGIAIISDEVYTPLVYETPAPSFAALAEDDDAVFVVNGFSKAWAMTGWRIGWVVHPSSLATQMHEMSAYNNSGATTFAQYGAVEAITNGDGFLNSMVERCRRGREIVGAFLAGQNRMSWSKPPGAFYGFIAVEGMSDSIGFAKRLVAEAKVGVAPGIAFGLPEDRENDRFIRLCFAQSPERLSEAMDRIAARIRLL
ncbi:MAG: pyridoxal phosphate-dependent aminotransferase [Alphaproteobacteria bacterium]